MTLVYDLCQSRVISELFISHEANNSNFSVTVKSPFKVVKSISFPESEESSVAMLLTASILLYSFCLLLQEREKCPTLLHL